MAALFRLYLDICFLRRGPQDVPPVPVLLWLTVGVYFVIGVMIGLSRHDEHAIAVASLDLALSGGLLAIMLWARGVLPRWGQTFTALCGSQMLLSLAVWPVLLWYARVQADAGSAGLPFLLFAGYLIWSLVVTGHVLRHAFDMPFWLGTVIAFGFQWTMIILMQGILPT